MFDVTTTADGSKSLPLLFLGQNTDPHSERGVECPGALPPASDPDLVERALRRRRRSATRCSCSATTTSATR